MVEMKYLSKDTDFSTLEMHKVNWDVVINGTPYQVYDIPGYVHTIGGRWGNNSYWCKPLLDGEEPSYKNMIQFNSEPVNWGLKVCDRSYIRRKYDDTIEHTISCEIYRNGELFYTVGANDFEYAIHKARTLMISEICEGPINFIKRDYEYDILGHEITHKGKPYTIVDFDRHRCCALAIPSHFGRKDLTGSKLRTYLGEKYAEFLANENRGDATILIDLLEDHQYDWYPHSEDNEI